MLITYLKDTEDKLLKVEATEIATFITDIADYSTVQITAKKDCCDTPVIQEYDTTEVLDADDSLFYIDEGILYVKPALFGLSAFTDGIYSFDIKFLKESGSYVLISNCTFVDVLYKCRVAALLQNIIKENETNGAEKVSTIAHVLHYALFNGSNCGCNCAELCQVFEELKELLSGIDPQITNDCGC